MLAAFKRSIPWGELAPSGGRLFPIPLYLMDALPPGISMWIPVAPLIAPDDRTRQTITPGAEFPPPALHSLFDLGTLAALPSSPPRLVFFYF